MKQIIYSLAILASIASYCTAQNADERNSSSPPVRAPIQIEDRIDPVGTVHYWLRVPTGNNSTITLKGTRYDPERPGFAFVYFGRFGYYGDGGGFERTPDGFGRIKEGTRVFVNKNTRFGFEIGNDGSPKAYLFDDKPVRCLIGLGRYRYFNRGTSNAWYDIYSGDTVTPRSKELESIELDDGKGSTRAIPLFDFIKLGQDTLDAAHKTNEAYNLELRKHKDDSDRLAAAIGFQQGFASDQTQQPKTNPELVISFEDLQADSTSTLRRKGGGTTHFWDGTPFLKTNDPLPNVEGIVMVRSGKERLVLSKPEVTYDGTVTVLAWTNIAGTATQRRVFAGAAATLITFKKHTFEEFSENGHPATNAAAVRLCGACRLTNAVVGIREYAVKYPKERKVEWVVKMPLPTSTPERKK